MSSERVLAVVTLTGHIIIGKVKTRIQDHRPRRVDEASHYDSVVVMKHPMVVTGPSFADPTKVGIQAYPLWIGSILDKESMLTFQVEFSIHELRSKKFLRVDKDVEENYLRYSAQAFEGAIPVDSPSADDTVVH